VETSWIIPIVVALISVSPKLIELAMKRRDRAGDRDDRT
jgi:hypothetical protein